VFSPDFNIQIDPLSHAAVGSSGVTLNLLRLDTVHEHVSGNKWWKLKYNLEAAAKLDSKAILTFGGAFSNHIAATAAACQSAGLRSIGVIRGEPTSPLNATLAFAVSCGMQLHFVSRADYKEKTSATFIAKLAEQFGAFHLVPEGGANVLGVTGCKEILQNVPSDYDAICCAMGTGTTVAGISAGLSEGIALHGFPVFKGGDYLAEEVGKWRAELKADNAENLTLHCDYHFGGYARIKPELVAFIQRFYAETGIQLDPIYTGKMLFGLCDLIQNNHFKAGTKILAIHTGGLQGIAGIEKRHGIRFFAE
jgi:1-aminocyclopropane-1-carboxylate deaminase/D-cysteine desulfhydrase-like pyridoxal-dependent ACC family enzyme